MLRWQRAWYLLKCSIKIRQGRKEGKIKNNKASTMIRKVTNMMDINLSITNLNANSLTQ